MSNSRGDRIRDVRRALGYTISDLATILNISLPRARRIESDSPLAQDEHVELLKKLLVSDSWLKRGKGFPFKDGGLIRVSPRGKAVEAAAELLITAIQACTRVDIIPLISFASSENLLFVCSHMEGLNLLIVRIPKSKKPSLIRRAADVRHVFSHEGVIFDHCRDLQRNKYLENQYLKIQSELGVIRSFIDNICEKKTGLRNFVSTYKSFCLTAIKRISLSADIMNKIGSSEL